MDPTNDDARPPLPASLTAEQAARYPAIAAIARRTAARLPHTADKSLEPAHVFDLHHAGRGRP